MLNHPASCSYFVRSHRRAAVCALGVLMAGIAASGCSINASAENTTASATTGTVVVSPLPPSSPSPTTAAPSTEASTTEVTTTLPPTTEATTTVPVNIEAVPPAPAPLAAVDAASGPATDAIQQRLLQLGFWLGDKPGSYGLTTRQAVMAFQKYLTLPATGKVDEATAAFLTNLTERPHGQADTGDLVEVDKTKQLLFLIREGKTLWTFNTSTGSGLPYEEDNKTTPGEKVTGVAITPDGLFKVNREHAEGWWEGDLGKIYRPKYFNGGIAVHGSGSVPNHPASHGCVRLSLPAMDFIWDQNLIPQRTIVWVHSVEMEAAVAAATA